MRASAAALVIAAALAAAPALARSGGDTIAYVNYGLLTSKAPQVKASRDLVQKQFGPQRKAIEEKHEQFLADRKKLLSEGPGTNPLERSAAMENFRHSRSALKQAEQQYETGLQLRENQLEASFRKLVHKEIAAYAHAHGIDLVLRAGVHYAGQAVNITNVVLSRLKRDYRQTQKADKGHS